jgi:FKBP-type peptidyl-prolyl cis-trans isomerase
MKFYLPIIFAALFLAAGCTADESCYDEKGLFTLEEYFERNPDLNLTEGEGGLFYTINEAGGAERPTLTADVTVAYQGTHVTGEVFDERPLNNPIDFQLSRLIVGWQIGLPLIGAGGNITLYVPSELAYGPRGAGADICPNSDLIFTLDLISFTQ